jgi:hypothetical protein
MELSQKTAGREKISADTGCGIIFSTTAIEFVLGIIFSDGAGIKF